MRMMRIANTCGELVDSLAICRLAYNLHIGIIHMHIPVLLDEVLEYLDPRPGDDFIDCTVGEGGHALAILKLTAPNGRVLGIDRDADMIERLNQTADRLGVSDRLMMHHGNFADIREIAEGHKFSDVRGVLFDLGVSSWHFDESGRGFSFRDIEPLDMRFDTSANTLTAAGIINSWPEEAIARIIFEFGEERYSRHIARRIVEERKKNRIETTDQLVNIISRAVPIRPFDKTRGKRARGKPRKSRGIHFATRTFQALRIAVNSELENVENGINEAISILYPKGRIAVISFHSLEDRIVKNIFKDYSKEGGPPSLANGELRKGKGLLRALTKKPVIPSDEEVSGNPRARSAKLRVAEKI